MNIPPEVTALAVPVIRLLMLAFHAYVSAAIGGTSSCARHWLGVRRPQYPTLNLRSSLASCT